MRSRQIAVSLIALIFIVGAALLIISRGDNSNEATSPSTTTTTIRATTTEALSANDDTTAAPDTTTTTTTTIAVAVPVNVPVVCTSDAAGVQVVAEASAGAATQLTRDSKVSTLGLGVVTFGLTVPNAAEQAGINMLTCGQVGDCYHISPASGPDGVSFLVHASTVERVDIVDGPITTRSGMGIGTSEERLVEAFGEKLEREVIDSDTTNLVFVPTDAGDADFRVVFTIEDGAVTTFRAGRLPMVLQDDPCA
ncbi:MAG: hypothetical protein KTU85_08555 [Acidimicrobiia bacterium]|nr:hypothetical protein [Acidimicrobiia bacterium]MCY4457353.1 hypothetical protein [Acidimicrobiaceae bacterium]